MTTFSQNGAATEDRWSADLQVKELKKLVQIIPSSAVEVAGLVERSDFENLVLKHYDSLDQARSTLGTLGRLQVALSQDRGVLNFEHYTPSEQHKDRLESLANVAPEVYQNPEITPRSKWFSHHMYRRNSQMPPFHVHFREEMQMTIHYLHEALEKSVAPQSSSAGSMKTVQKSVQRALQYFHGCMRGLNGHVRIEEYACFPLYEQTFPQVKLEFLYHDHKELHRAEGQVSRALDDFQQRLDDASTTTTNSKYLLDLIKLVLDFDDHLMAHLGEEEELVVPLSLTDKRIHF